MMHAHLSWHYRWQRRALLQCPCYERSKGQHIARQRWKRPQLNHFSSKCPLRHMNTFMGSRHAIYAHAEVKCVCQIWKTKVLLPPNFWTCSSISSHSSPRVEVIWGGRRVFLPQAHEHPQEQAHCSHQKDHQASNQGLPNHFPAQEIQHTWQSDRIPQLRNKRLLLETSPIMGNWTIWWISKWKSIFLFLLKKGDQKVHSPLL